MVTVTLNGKPFNYVDTGTGEPIVHILGLESRWTIKGGVRDSSGIPRLAKINALTSKYRILAYNNYNQRTEYATSNDPFGSLVTRPITDDQVKQASNDCYAFIQSLNIARAHIFAHSNVGFVALRLALDHPELINSIALLEFELASASFVEDKGMRLLQGFMQKTAQRAAANPEKVRAILARVSSQTGLVPPSGQTAESLSRDQTPILAGANPEEFQMRMKILSSLALPMEEVQERLRQPILAITWDYSLPPYKISSQLLKSWLQQTEIFTISKREHWYQENLNGLALGLIDFLGHYPLQ